ncbi:tannase and feruloyl esterase [Mycena vitilis]|nr:tannase and feruloyl esterase [Mycena vitilis]
MEFGLHFLSKLITSGLPLLLGQGTQHAQCLALKSSLKLENTTILDVSYVAAGTTLKLPAGINCPSEAYVDAPICRVQSSANTTTVLDTSRGLRVVRSIPGRRQRWTRWMLKLSRFAILRTGQPSTSRPLAQTTGTTAIQAVRSFGILTPEVLNDFAFRSIHVEALIGKQIVEEYYGRPNKKSYYLGCSTGGRQGTYSALNHPEDFHGIIARAPATDFNRLLHWEGMLARHIGAPSPSPSPAFITPDLWKVIEDETLHQCDGIDVVVDGIITVPDACNFRPEAFQCIWSHSPNCPSRPQVQALRKIFSPLYDNGELIYPRYDPGSSGDFDFNEYGPEHGRISQAINAGGIATFDGREFLFVTEAGNFSPTTAAPTRSSHRATRSACTNSTVSSSCPGWNTARKAPAHGGPRNASSHNLLLALVDWVEGGVADTIVGTGRIVRRACIVATRCGSDRMICIVLEIDLALSSATALFKPNTSHVPSTSRIRVSGFMAISAGHQDRPNALLIFIHLRIGGSLIR